MSLNNKDIERIEKKLFAAWERSEANPGEDWRRKLMDDIRRNAEAEYTGEEIFGTTAWHFAIAAGIAAFLLIAYSFYQGILMDMDLSTLFALDPGGTMLSPPFGLV